MENVLLMMGNSRRRRLSGWDGIEVDVTENKHQVFADDCNGLRLVVPAIVVLKALFRSNATVFDYLFRPW